eukprot:TRINITY_DN12782_c0_g1_i1.p2 TRINITY_DN12782_c0_g1~~TRINITY_DN12782_c0_g1_i1.p2  ORF type:complete len:102 (+),score=3.21 TRINITY_DN12782_c0_g1_i1:364-669(+)
MLDKVAIWRCTKQCFDLSGGQFGRETDRDPGRTERAAHGARVHLGDRCAPHNLRRSERAQRPRVCNGRHRQAAVTIHKCSVGGWRAVRFGMEVGNNIYALA